MSSVLSDKNILEAMEDGSIIIEPFDLDHLSTSSYDVTLGEYYFRENKNDSIFFNPYSKKDITKVWGEFKKAISCEEHNLFFENIDPKTKIILLEPGETILAHTNEFIGGKNNVTTMMKARSSIGRSFIEICKCAGWGDVGYTNRWTMEITNNSRYHTIPLQCGKRLAQIIFFKTGEINNQSYEKTGKYQTTDDLDILIKNWSPSMMLPKLYDDTGKL